jgi:hypothetical protein
LRRRPGVVQVGRLGDADAMSLPLRPQILALDISPTPSPQWGPRRSSRDRWRPRQLTGLLPPCPSLLTSCPSQRTRPLVATRMPGHFQSVAETLVRNRVTTKEPELVAMLLADRAAGMRPTAIANKHGVHHSVVKKVLDAAERPAG